jgi:hypothetical protein
MNGSEAVTTMRHKLEASGRRAQIPLLKGGCFNAELTDKGIEVDNLGNQPLLPWAVFEETVSLLASNGGRAKRGDAMGCRLGEPGLPVDSVEGHIASVVYNRRPGDTVFRRITPVACILIWAGICRAVPRELVLRR